MHQPQPSSRHTETLLPIFSIHTHCTFVFLKLYVRIWIALRQSCIADRPVSQSIQFTCCDIVPASLWDTGVGCMVTLRPPEEEGRTVRERRAAGTALDCIFFVLSFDLSSFPLFLAFFVFPSGV